MRWMGTVFGALLAVIGAVWVGQGIGLIRGSFMTGVTAWEYIGVGCMLAGFTLILLTVRGRPGRVRPGR